MNIKLSTMYDLEKILSIYEQAREFMRKLNNPDQ